MDLRVVTTAAELEAALLVRKRVFVDEQGVSPELEVDEYDVFGGVTTHAVLVIDYRVVAAGRLRRLGSNMGKLERLAVLPEERGKGVGRALTAYFETLGREQGLVRLTLNAQHTASDFYQRLGYSAVGAQFMEAGIVHQQMEKSLS